MLNMISDLVDEEYQAVCIINII